MKKVKVGNKEIDLDSEGLNTQNAINDAVTAAISEATTTLTEKNTELLGELKTVKKKLVPDDELAGLRETATKYETLKADKMRGNEEYERLLNESKAQHATELNKYKEQNDKLSKQIRKSLVSDSLTKALTKANVNPGLLDAAVTMLSGKVAVIEKDDVQVALVGDKTIPQFVEEWAGTDEGKHFVRAPGNGGGGSGGDGTGGGGYSEYEKYFDPKSADFNHTQQAQVYKKDPKAYDELTKKFANAQQQGAS